MSECCGIQCSKCGSRNNGVRNGLNCGLAKAFYVETKKGNGTITRNFTEPFQGVEGGFYDLWICKDCGQILRLEEKG